jgi:acetyltransferase
MFQSMWRRRQNLQSLYETPSLDVIDEAGAPSRETIALIERVLDSGRTLLTEYESKRLLAAFDIPTVETRLAATAEEAVRQAREIGFPVVLKLNSTTITHKARVGGVRLNLDSEHGVIDAFHEIAAAVENAAGPGNFSGVTVQPMVRQHGYELIFGSSVDSQLGPVILFGAGGSAVEIFRDKALGLPPLTSTLARRMMERTKIHAAIRDSQRQTVNLASVEQLLVRFASLVLEYPRIKEIDINPLLVYENGNLALDVRAVLYPRSIADGDLPRPAIRPYPRQYVGECRTRDSRRLQVRPIRPEDEPLLAKFHESLSENSVYLRYAQVLSLSRRTVHERLARLCFIDYDRQMALVAIARDATVSRLVAVARLIKLHGTSDAEFAIVISDAYQGQGLGTCLMERLVAVGRGEGVGRIIGYIHATNRQMLRICRRLGFEITGSSSSRTAVLNLSRVVQTG